MQVVEMGTTSSKLKYSQVGKLDKLLSYQGFASILMKGSLISR